MNNLSIVSHIKNETEFLEQFWKHIHSFDPREIIIIDTGSVDDTYERLLTFTRDERIAYTIKQEPHYTGQVFLWDKIIDLATSKWVMKIDADELYRHETIYEILKIIEQDKFNCINLPTIHHFVNSDWHFNVLKDVPDYHQRVFKKSIYNTNAETWSKNHGSLIWNEGLKMITLGIEHAMYHYSMLRPLWKLHKRAIINHFIDDVKNTGEDLIEIEKHPNDFINDFLEGNIKVTPVWQLKPTKVPFTELEDFYISEFVKYGRRVDFPKPQDLIVNEIWDWAKAKEALNNM